MMRSRDSRKDITSSYAEDSGGREIDSLGKRAGKGALIQWDKSMTLGVSQDQTLFVWKETE